MGEEGSWGAERGAVGGEKERGGAGGGLTRPPGVAAYVDGELERLRTSPPRFFFSTSASSSARKDASSTTPSMSRSKRMGATPLPISIQRMARRGRNT